MLYSIYLQSEDIREDVKLATCSLNVKPESKSIPTSLHEATGFNCCPINSTEMSDKRWRF